MGCTLLSASRLFLYGITTLTVVLGFVGILGTYGILRELKAPRLTAAVGALTLAFCPIYFALSLTFMNDVPFTAFAIASIYFFIRGNALESPLKIAVSFLLAGVAILTRQTGLALPIAFACALLAKGNSAAQSFVSRDSRGGWNRSSVCLPNLALSYRRHAGKLQQANFYNFSQLTNASAAHAL